MQISRHWRLNPLRYRLQGVRYEDGKVSIQARPTVVTENKLQTTEVQAVQKGRPVPASVS